MKKHRERLQGFIAGILVVLLLLPLGTALGAPTWSSRNISVLQGGIRVVVNGQQITPRDAQGNVVEPIIFEGTTFMPLRAISEALGYPADWNPHTTTAYIGTRTRAPQPFLDAAPWVERNRVGGTLQVNNATMNGVFYPNAILSSHNSSAQWSRHELNRQFSTLTGVIGREDGSGALPGSITFIGDGRTLAVFSVGGDTRPQNVSVDVRGVSELEIRVQLATGGTTLHRALIGFANATIQ